MICGLKVSCFIEIINLPTGASLSALAKSQYITVEALVSDHLGNSKKCSKLELIAFENELSSEGKYKTIGVGRLRGHPKKNVLF